MSAQPPDPTPDAGTPPDALLGSLLSAMREVAEASRRTSLAAAREAAERTLAEFQERAAADSGELRRRAGAEVDAIRAAVDAEVEQLQAEAQRRIDARRARLQREEADLRSVDEHQAAQVQERLAEHERRVAAFFEELSRINDPAAFVALARQMPAAPDFGTPVAPAAPAAPAPVTALALPAEGAPSAAEATNGASESPGTVPTAPAPASAPAAPSATTAIAVAGHDSFGAVTMLKQALAGVEGIDEVVLSLGDGAEFVLTARHHPSVDVRRALLMLDLTDLRVEGDRDRLRVALGGSV